MGNGDNTYIASFRVPTQALISELDSLGTDHEKYGSTLDAELKRVIENIRDPHEQLKVFFGFWEKVHDISVKIVKASGKISLDTSGYIADLENRCINALPILVDVSIDWFLKQYDSIMKPHFEDNQTQDEALKDLYKFCSDFKVFLIEKISDHYDLLGIDTFNEAIDLNKELKMAARKYIASPSLFSYAVGTMEYVAASYNAIINEICDILMILKQYDSSARSTYLEEKAVDAYSCLESCYSSLMVAYHTIPNSGTFCHSPAKYNQTRDTAYKSLSSWQSTLSEFGISVSPKVLKEAKPRDEEKLILDL